MTEPLNQEHSTDVIYENKLKSGYSIHFPIFLLYFLQFAFVQDKNVSAVPISQAPVIFCCL
jgi:hypothetical protein